MLNRISWFFFFLPKNDIIWRLTLLLQRASQIRSVPFTGESTDSSDNEDNTRVTSTHTTSGETESSASTGSPGRGNKGSSNQSPAKHSCTSPTKSVKRGKCQNFNVFLLLLDFVIMFKEYLVFLGINFALFVNCFLLQKLFLWISNLKKKNVIFFGD